MRFLNKKTFSHFFSNFIFQKLFLSSCKHSQKEEEEGTVVMHMIKKIFYEQIIMANQDFQRLFK
jgi:hypothetical protein